MMKFFEVTQNIERVSKSFTDCWWYGMWECTDRLPKGTKRSKLKNIIAKHYGIDKEFISKYIKDKEEPFDRFIKKDLNAFCYLDESDRRIFFEIKHFGFDENSFISFSIEEM